MKTVTNNNEIEPGKFSKYAPGCLIMSILVLMALVMYHRDLTEFFDPGYRKINHKLEQARKFYTDGDNRNAFQKYKKAMEICSEHGYDFKKSNIFNEMERKIGHEGFYYDFLADIFEKQFVRQKGESYKYSMDVGLLMARMVSKNTSATLALFDNLTTQTMNRIKGNERIKFDYESYILPEYDNK